MYSIIDKYLLTSIPREGEGTGNPPPPADTWFKGADAETIGHIQNRGWDKKPAGEVALEAIKSHKEAERLLGVPADRRLTLPAAGAEPTVWRESVWSKLGVPAEAKDYDFATVKDAAGQPIAQALADTLRTAFHAANVPKEAAAKVAADVVKHFDGAKASELTEAQAKLDTERAALKTSWGNNHDANMVVARQGAAKVGVTPEEVQTLEKTVGYSKVMEIFRKIGAGLSEDKFQGGGPGGEGAIVTKEQAIARKAELLNDDDWKKRYMAGGVAENRELTKLIALIAG